jgi:hypothetical protein
MPIWQQGPLTPGHTLRATTNGVAQDAGGAQNGNLTELGITNTGTPSCVRSNDPASGGYRLLCMGAQATIGSVGPPPGGGGGSVVGPSLSAVGDCALWANTGGTLLGDLGAPCFSTVPSNAALKAIAAPPTGAVVYRAGFYLAGDGGAATYAYSTSGCSINTGAGDNGSQVQPTIGGGCWNKQPQSATDLRVWGATQSADMAPYVQAAYNANVGCVLIPAGIWQWNSAVTMTAQQPCFQGAGWNEAVQAPSLSPSYMTGTWISRSSPGFNPVTITGVTGQGATPGFGNIAFYDVQPAVGPGWAPTNYPPWFSATGNLGRLDWDNLLFYNTTGCISLVNSARSHVANISGQPEGACIFSDQQHDISFLDNIDFWTFWSASPYVGAYQQANVDPILYDRADSPFVGKVFVYGYHSGMAFGVSSNGITTGAQIGSLQVDATKFSAWVKPGASGTQLQIGNLRTDGDVFLGGAYLAGSEGYRDDGGGTVDIANFQCFDAGSNCVDIPTAAGRLSIANAQLWNFNNDNNSSVGLNAGTAGWISVANQPNVVNPKNGGTVIPPVSAGGTYAIRGTRQQWTPTVVGTTTAGTVTYTTQVGTFWYDGSLLTVSFNVNVSGTSGMTGSVAVKGLPFTLNGTTNQNAFCSISSHSGIVLDSNYTVMSGIYAAGGTSQALLVESGGGVSTQPIPASDFGSGTGPFSVEGTCTLAAGQ